MRSRRVVASVVTLFCVFLLFQLPANLQVIPQRASAQRDRLLGHGLMSLLQGRFAGLSVGSETHTKPFPVGV